MVLNNSHKKFCDNVYEFYYENRDSLIYAKEKILGTDQTPINYLTDNSI